MHRLEADLAGFAADVFGSLTRSGWQDRAVAYLQGLMLDGRRKSIQPMAARLDGFHDQALNHFVTNSPWDVVPVRRRLARRMEAEIGPVAWAFDDTGLLKDGTIVAVRGPPVHRHGREGHQLPGRGVGEPGDRYRVVSGRLAAVRARVVGSGLAESDS